MDRTAAFQHPDRLETASAGDRIAWLQHHVQVLMDGDRLLPVDGASLLAALDRARKGLVSRERPAARAALEAFICGLEALIDGRVLTTGDGRPPIEAAALIAASLLAASGSDR
jgi:hypothetical protein